MKKIQKLYDEAAFLGAQAKAKAQMAVKPDLAVIVWRRFCNTKPAVRYSAEGK
jgi:hypothetical protein